MLTLPVFTQSIKATILECTTYCITIQRCRFTNCNCTVQSRWDFMQSEGRQARRPVYRAGLHHFGVAMHLFEQRYIFAKHFSRRCPTDDLRRIGGQEVFHGSCSIDTLETEREKVIFMCALELHKYSVDFHFFVRLKQQFVGLNVASIVVFTNKNMKYKQNK